MRKEYKVEMFKNGKWLTVTYPWQLFPHRVDDSLERAKEIMEQARRGWEVFSKHNGGKYGVDIPIEYRIVSRAVTEWR